MGIIKINKHLMIIFSLILLVSSITFNPSKFLLNNQESLNLENIYSIKTSGDSILVDKVFIFKENGSTLKFENLDLQSAYTYQIYIEIVTPHSCIMNISILDPLDRKFDIFGGYMAFYPKYYRYYTIPFGTALSGNYTFTFEVFSKENLNIYIKIEQKFKCLYERISPFDLDDLIFYKVNCFNNEYNIVHEILLETDRSYKFFFERVSPISLNLSNEVRLDFYLIDPNNNRFKIYENYRLPEINNFSTFQFGTSLSGIYTFYLKISCNVDWVNIAYAILDDYKISTEINQNNTNGKNNNTSLNRFQFFLPSDLIFGIIFLFGTIMMIVITVVIIQKRRISN